ncbi:MAG TPA: hypothetical protein DIU35_19105 [Candidatus Latescibacteria bacterium]|nr:hypothetical protein [Candidatus Latescibacterota bacterium]
MPTIPVSRCVFTGKRSFLWRFETPNKGLQPNEQGWDPISHEMDTLAERFHEAGFATGLVSDVYHRFKATMNFTRGFVSWRFIRGQENDQALSLVSTSANTREGEADSDPEVIVFDLEARPGRRPSASESSHRVREHCKAPGRRIVGPAAGPLQAVRLATHRLLDAFLRPVPFGS